MQIILVVLSFFSLASFADEAPLDPSYGPAHKVILARSLELFPRFILEDDFRRSNLEKNLRRQTPVRAQGGRGTCSIFSATGALESLLKIANSEEFDFSENYLEYLVMNHFKPNNPTEGSDTPWNFSAYRSFGAIFEERWPYESSDWTKPDISEDERVRRDDECGGLRGRWLTSCHLTHRRPGIDPDASEARGLWKNYRLGELSYRVVNRQGIIQKILDSGYPMILSTEFFYGAWNHRLMVEYGLGDRDMEAWGRGNVSTPSKGDIQISRAHPAGHSFVIVGYDDEKRVYHFKNSWGTGSFGRNSQLVDNKEISTDGYGTISYDYAHNFGTFYRVGLGSTPE